VRFCVSHNGKENKPQKSEIDAMVQTYSWSDMGYRKTGPLPAAGGGASPADIVRLLSQDGANEITPDNGWFRRRCRRKGVRPPESIKIIDVIDKGTVLDDVRLSYIPKHASSDWMKIEAQMTRYRVDFHVAASIIADSEGKEEPARMLYRLVQALGFVGPEALRAMFRQHVAPCFFRLHPDAKIVVMNYNTDVETWATELRILYAMAQAPLAELRNEKFQGIRTMQEWHMGSLTKIVNASLDLFSSIFYPFIGGVCANLPGLVFYFFLDPPQKYELPNFPRNWLAYASTSGSFGKERIGLESILGDFHGPVHVRAAHNRYCHEKGFGADERLQLLRWYVERLNRILFELNDAANFTEGLDCEAPIDPVFGYEHYLTIDRLFRSTLLGMSLDEAPTANLMGFDIADLYDTISRRLGNTKNDIEFFKMLFNTQDAPLRITQHISGMPAPFADYFSGVAKHVYEMIEKTVVGSVWRSGKVTANGILVRDKNLANEAVMANPQFVADVMRAFRNAHHGYFTSGDQNQNRPSRFLYLVDGNLPVEMSALPVLWWLAYLADPKFVGWNHLPLGAFD